MESPVTPDRIPRRPSRLTATLKALFRTRVTAGLLVVLPVYVTFLLVTFVFGVMRDASQWIVEAFLRSRFGATFLQAWHVYPDEIETRLGHTLTPAELVGYLPRAVQWGIPIASVLLTIFILYIIGLFAANIVGRRAIDLMENVVDRVPLVKTIYRASKQILTAFSGEQSQNIQRVCLVPFPDPSMRAVGFITNSMRDAVTGEELCAVLIPTTPNPTTAYLQIMPRAVLTELPWSVEEAVRTIMSGGMLMAGHTTMVLNKDMAKGSFPPSPSPSTS